MAKNKKQKELPKEGTRIPRPKGYTLALQSLQSIKDQKQKKDQLNYLKQLIIEQWTMNNYQYQQVHYTLNQISNLLNLPIAITMKIMQNSLLRLANFFGKDEDKLRDMARAEIFRSLNWATESHSLAYQQVAILMAHQGNEYKPYVSGEVNRAIANLLSANKPLQEAIKLMTPGSNGPAGTNIQINNNNSSVKYLTPEQAVIRIREHSESLITNTNLIPGVPELQDEAIPDISARTQDLSKIGIKKLPQIDKMGPTTQSNFEHGTRDNLRIEE